MFNLHSLIKFWARKDPELISHELKRSRIIADPFCGSGSSGFSAVFNNVSAILSDVNPVSVFIAYNVLNDKNLKPETVELMKNLCSEIECETYVLSNSQKVSFAVWKNDNVVSLKFATGKSTQNKDLIKEYVELEENLKVKWWYPKDKFIYPNTKVEFRDGPHKPIGIRDLFTKRNLYAASKLYSCIEKIWKKDKIQGDLLKLVFIASLANATKMIPHAESSGPSWKVPRYWIPNLREERNFCRTFLRRLLFLRSFKEKWSASVSNYQITASFDREITISKEKFIHLYRADALDLYSELPTLDLVILDPPHYDEINYFELTYFWQKWLEGNCNDVRFRCYDYWNKEICVNRKIGKDLQWYEAKLCEVVSCYTKRLHKKGKVILILHNKDRNLLKKTIRKIKKAAGNKFMFTINYKFSKIPSSTQGLHGHKKYLCIVRMRRIN